MAEMDTSSGGGHKKGPGVKKPKNNPPGLTLHQWLIWDFY